MTTQHQMLHSNFDSLYVWPDIRTVRVAEKMAYDLGCGDLKIVPVHYVTDRYFEGRLLTGIVVDHACSLTHDQRMVLYWARQRLIPGVKRTLWGENIEQESHNA